MERSLISAECLKCININSDSDWMKINLTRTLQDISVTARGILTVINCSMNETSSCCKCIFEWSACLIQVAKLQTLSFQEVTANRIAAICICSFQLFVNTCCKRNKYVLLSLSIWYKSQHKRGIDRQMQQHQVQANQAQCMHSSVENVSLNKRHI